MRVEHKGWVGGLTSYVRPVSPRYRAISDLRPYPVGCTSESEVSREGYLIICAHESGQYHIPTHA